jgi:hypothetical protein
LQTISEAASNPQDKQLRSSSDPTAKTFEPAPNKLGTNPEPALRTNIEPANHIMHTASQPLLRTNCKTSVTHRNPTGNSDATKNSKRSNHNPSVKATAKPWENHL